MLIQTRRLRSTIVDGLVFHYDMYDSRSWRSAPTTNYLDNPSQLFERGEFGQYYDLAPIFESHGLVPYSLSFEMLTDIPGYVSWYMQNGSYTKYAFVSHALESTTEWRRYTFNNVTPSGPTAAWLANSPTDHRAMLATYTIYGSGRNPKVRNMQLEKGAVATPFVVGTRGATPYVLSDIARDHPITAANLVYDAGNNFSFNGTNSRLTVPTPSFTLYNLSFWMYNNNVVVNNDGAIGGPTPYQSPVHFNDTSTYGVNLGGWTGAVLNESFHIWSATAGGYMTYNQTPAPIGWHHLSFNWNGSYYDIWLDGVKTVVYGHPSGHAKLAQITSLTIGGDPYSNYYFYGKLPMVSCYNRQLSDGEVQQNFNSQRQRYGI